MVPIKVPMGDRVVTERHVKLNYKDGAWRCVVDGTCLLIWL